MRGSMRGSMRGGAAAAAGMAVAEVSAGGKWHPSLRAAGLMRGWVLYADAGLCRGLPGGVQTAAGARRYTCRTWQLQAASQLGYSR
jgi:hypothetical protein